MTYKGHHAHLTAFGETKTMTEWLSDERCAVTKISTLSSRCAKGMADEDAITTPLGAGTNEPYRLTLEGETKTVLAWLSDDRCVPKMRSTIMSRIRKGWSDEDTLTRPVTEQRRPRSQITAWGETKSVPEWIDDPRCQVDSLTLWRRVNRANVTAEAAMSVPPGRLTKAITAWGESKTPKQWEKDERCRVKAKTIIRRMSDGGLSAEAAISTPGAREGEGMTLAEQFEVELRAMVALGAAGRFDTIDLVLLQAAASAVGSAVQISNYYRIGHRFCLGLWAPVVPMLDFVAEATALTCTEDRFSGHGRVLRKLIRAAQRQEQGAGDLYLFPDWLAADQEGAVWRG